MSNLVKRTLSALILGPLFVYISYMGGLPFFGMIFTMFIIMFYEWLKITSKSEQRILWFVFGFFYIGFACFVMLSLERLRGNFAGMQDVPILYFTLVFLVWINDIFSYAFGKTIGGPKLLPKISPNKTWAGTIGGIIGCVSVLFILSYSQSTGASTVSDQVFLTALAIHILVPIVALAGDLFESSIKRKFGVKDSGNIMPGHGGLLDRMDGMILVMNVTGIIFIMMFAAVAGRVAAFGAMQ